LNDVLAALRPGSDIDLRGTPLPQDLLGRVLVALTPDGDGAVPSIGTTRFQGAQFSGHASFGGAQFSGDAYFSHARFKTWSGPLACEGDLYVTDATVTGIGVPSVAARWVFLGGTRFDEPAMFSVRYAAVDLTALAPSAPVTVAGHAAPFAFENTPLDEQGLSGKDPRATVVSLAGADAANIVLSNVDLSQCVFSGAHHLDQIRLQGRCQFAAAPRGWYWGRAWIPVRRWSARKVLAEEAAWRADDQRRPALARASRETPRRPPRTREEAEAEAKAETPGQTDALAVPAASPGQLALLYRQLRESLEDSKNAPGAADFYYGEMESRRHDTEGTPRGERWLLHAYWLLSGYALRASRALGFLAATAAATFLLLMALGLPDNQLNPQATGIIPAPGGHATFTASTPDPVLTLPLSQRFTATRADRAGLVVVNSVIFRSTDTTLTAPGRWIEIISRIGEPVLLALAVVAARGRLHR